MPLVQSLCEALWDAGAVTVSATPLTLKSGRQSHVYVSLRHFLCDAENLVTLGDVFARFLGGREIVLASAASLLSPVLAGAFAARFGLPLMLYRADDSEKGLAGQVFGQAASRPAIILDDVLTSGGTALAAARAYRENGAGDISLYVFVDKRPRARREDFPLPVAAPLTLEQLLRHGIDGRRLTSEQVALAATELDYLKR